MLPKNFMPIVIMLERFMPENLMLKKTFNLFTPTGFGAIGRAAFGVFLLQLPYKIYMNVIYGFSFFLQ